MLQFTNYESLSLLQVAITEMGRFMTCLISFLLLLKYCYYGVIPRTLRRRIKHPEKCLFIIVVITASIMLLYLQIPTVPTVPTIPSLTSLLQFQTTAASSRCGVLPRGNKTLIIEPPNMLLLQNLNMFQRISTDSFQFGTNLLEDKGGNKMNNINHDERQIENINRRILQQWLDGKGRKPITWNTLISVLSEVGLLTLTEDISSKISVDYCSTTFLHKPLDAHHQELARHLKQRYLNCPVVEFDLLKELNAPFLDDLVLRYHGEHGTIDEDIQQVLSDIELHKRLLITGQPGSGKTTLMRYIAKQWAKGKMLRSCQLLFLFYLGEYRRYYHGDSLDNLLSMEYSDMHFDIPSLTEAILHNSGYGTCLLFDAFDERTTKQEHNYVYKVMFYNELPDSISILTSWPDDDLMKLNYSFEIIGYRLYNLDSYLEKLSKNNTVTDRVKKFWKTKQVKEMCQLPLHMAMIVFIAQSTHASSIQTKTQIYTAVVNCTIRHYMHKYSHSGHYWNTGSLRHCIFNRMLEGGDEL